ncbi:hypothetical protein EW146_g391 [Bondarzewia mesenterica]|uniref:ER membrane protein complex subunit 4 n=1 Tax=Bondarzewia mesenterica TaxID=1095465 RepID=A0A4S4M8Z2_9AGAM|nr:hypothetical protein EW146_g391 [Bondarzewia mesenterica]
MPSAFTPIFAVYDYTLTPLAPLTWLGASVSVLDLAAAFRLALVLRQMREAYRRDHAFNTAKNEFIGGRSGKDRPPLEVRARARDLATTLVMVYGGEAVVGIQPSFMISSAIPAVFLGADFLIEYLPSVPLPTVYNEIPLAILDAFTRAILLCNFVPTIITSHVSPVISSSPWTLLLTALPSPMSITTPPELLPYGWTATDIWVAPLITGIYATLTHAQPFFATLHELLYALFAPVDLVSANQKGSRPTDPDTARAACVVIMSILFVTRAVRTYGGTSAWSTPGRTVGGSSEKNLSAKNIKSGGQNGTKTKLQWRNLAPPPGFASFSSGKAAVKSTHAVSAASTASYEALKEKRAWDLAISPAKSLPMQAFMLYMSGGGVQIFSMGIVAMLLLSPFTNLAGINAGASFFSSVTIYRAVEFLSIVTSVRAFYSGFTIVLESEREHAYNPPTPKTSLLRMQPPHPSAGTVEMSFHGTSTHRDG